MVGRLPSGLTYWATRTSECEQLLFDSFHRPVSSFVDRSTIQIADSTEVLPLPELIGLDKTSAAGLCEKGYPRA